MLYQHYEDMNLESSFDLYYAACACQNIRIVVYIIILKLSIYLTIAG